MLERDLVGVLERPELDRLHLREAEEQQDRLLEPFVHHDLPVDRLGDAGLAGVEQVDGGVHGGEGVAVGRGELVAPRPQRFYLRLQAGHCRLRLPESR